jgi:hypothetical protein
MAEPIINEMEEEVVIQPTEEPIVGEEPKKTGEEPKKQVEQVLFQLKDGNQVNVVSSAIEDFKKKYPDATEVVSVDDLGKKPSFQTDATAEPGTLKNPTKIVGDDGEVGEVKVDVNQDDYNNVKDLLFNQDLLSTSMSESKRTELNEIKGIPKPGINFNQDIAELNSEIEEYARQNKITVDDAAQVVIQQKQAEKANEIRKNDQKKLEALAKVYAEKNNVNYNVAKSLFQKVYDEDLNIQNKLETYQQSTILAQSILDNNGRVTPKGNIDLDAESYSAWENAATTSVQTQYQLIQDRIARGELKQAMIDADKLQTDLLNKANIESYQAFKNGIGVDRKQVANQSQAYAVALMAKIQYQMGNYDEAKRLEQLARDNGAYQGMEKLESIQAKINETKDEKEIEKLQKEYQDEYSRISLPVVGGEEYGYKQPEVSTGSTYGFSGKNAPGTTTPTAESEYLKDIAGAAELVSGLQPLKDAEHLIGDGFKDLGMGYIGYDKSKGITFDKFHVSSPLQYVSGIVKIAMGLSAVQKPTGFLTFEAFAAANATPAGQWAIENIVMFASKKAKPFLRSMGLEGKDLEDAGLLTDIAAAMILHGGYNIISGKLKTNAAYNKLAEQIKSGNVDENLVKEIFNSVSPKQQQKIIRKIVTEYKKNPVEVKQELAADTSKLLSLIATKETVKKSSYTPEEHPATVSEIKNDSKVVMKDGTEGKFNISDEGIMSITDAEGNRTVIETKGDAPVAEAGIQLVKSKVSEELEAQARVNRPDAGTIVINGKKYFVSLEGKTADGLGDFVFEMDEKGNMYNTFDVNPNKDIVGQNKLDIVNSFRDRKGLEKVTEVTEALPADVEPVSSADAVTQKVAKLRKVEATEGADRASVKEAKRAITDLLAKNPKVKFVYDNMREVLEQITNNERFKLKGDCL